MRWQLASTFALTAMSAACYGPNRIVCEKDSVTTGVLCPDDLECTGNTSAGEVLCADQGDIDACAGPDRERTPCSSAPTANGLCIANVCTSCAMFPDDFECRYTQWTQMVSPAQSLSAVWVSAPNDAYAVGGNDVLHYNGKTWTHVAVIPGGQLQGVWSDSAGLFVIGFDGRVYQDRATTPNAMAPSGLRGIWGRSSSDVIAVGDEDVVGRWAAASWSWSIPAGFQPYRAVGGAGDAVIAVGEGRVAMVTGTTFTALPELPTGYTTDVLKGIWGTSSDDFYVVGDHGISGSEGVIHHYVGGVWAPPVVVTQRLHGVWGDGATIYAVGDGGLIVTSATSWGEQRLDLFPSLRGISGNNGDAIAIADSGAIWRISPPP